MIRKTKAPPLGPTPRFMRDEERILELTAAIARYLNAHWPVPDFIIEEYNILTKALPMED